MIWFIVLFVIGCLVIFLWPGLKSLIVTIEDLENLPTSLLKRGFHDGSLTISVLFSRKHIKLEKYIAPNKNYGIALHFPDVKWSHIYYLKLLGHCQKEKISFKIMNNNGADFLRVDFGKDSMAAYLLIKTIILEIFNLDSQTKLSFNLENLSLKDELINDPSI